jgi:hypothetical protein
LDTGSPKNTSNGPDAVCTADGGKSSATVGDGGLQKWILNPTVAASVTSGSATVTASSSGAFTQGEVGLPISGTGIAAGATITAVSSAGKTATMSANATGTNAGDSVSVSGWSLAYTLYNGLNLVLNSDCDPNSATTQGSLATTGLYGVTGVVSGGVATLYVTSYPNNDLVQSFLYGITDTLATTTMTSPGTAFTLLDTAPANSVFRGVSFVPTIPNGDVEVTAAASGVPASFTVTTSGSGCNPSTFLAPLTQAWTPGSSCTLSVVTPQGASGQQYAFSQWQDGTTSTTDHVTAPSTTAVYTATFTAQPDAVYSPANSSTLTGSSATFQWGGYLGATAFWIDVGSTPGAHDIYSSGSLSNSTFSQTVSSLPTNGSTVYVTWYYLLNGSWVSRPYNYTAFGGTSGAAAITSPAPNSMLTGSSVTFSWSAATDTPQAYWLDIGSTAGAHDIYSSGSEPTSTISLTVNGLPTNGATVYATMYTETGGVWVSNAYTYTAFNVSAADGVMTTPTPGSTLTGSSVTFDWTAGSGASGYWIDIGSTAGGHDIYSSGNLGNVLTATVNGLPTDGSTIYVTLYTLIGGTWSGNAYTYTTFNATGGIAVMQTPPPGSTLSGNTVTFTWSSDANATGYWVDVSAVGPGGNDLDSSGNLGTAQTETIYNLPADGSTLYVTLYSYVGGQWLSNAYTYVSGP